MDLNDTLKDVAAGATEKVQDMVKEGVEGKIGDFAGGVIDQVEAVADTIGLGEVVDTLVGTVEEKIGLDIDGEKEA